MKEKLFVAWADDATSPNNAIGSEAEILQIVGTWLEEDPKRIIYLGRIVSIREGKLSTPKVEWKLLREPRSKEVKDASTS